MNTPIKITAFIFFLALSVLYRPCDAQEIKKHFYDTNLSQDMDIWKLREKNLTDEEKKELDKHVELLNEARLKEQRAAENLDEAQRRLSSFISGRAGAIEKEKAKLREEIARVQQKAAKTQEKLDKEKQDVALLERNFDVSVDKAQEALNKQQQKLEETLRSGQESLAVAQENINTAVQKISDFKRGIEGKFQKQ